MQRGARGLEAQFGVVTILPVTGQNLPGLAKGIADTEVIAVAQGLLYNCRCRDDAAR